MNTPPPPSVTNADTLKAYQRLCHVIKRQNFDGYGFNLHSEKGKIGQYIGKIDANSPAETAGLKEGDRIIEVNGVNIGSETHKQVVQRIKAISNEVQLLIIDPAKEKEILQMQKTILNATAVTTKSTNVGQSDPEILTSSTITIKSTSTTSSSAKENNKVIMSTFAKQPPPPSFTTIVSSSTEQTGSSLIVDDDDTQKVSTTKKETEKTIISTSSEIKSEEPSEDIVDNCNIKIPIFEKISKNCEKDSKLNSTKNNAMKLNDTNNHNFNQNNFQHTDEIFITNNENNSSNSINNIHLNNNNLNKNQTNFNYEEDNMDHKNSKSITETTTITTTSINDDDDNVNGSNNNKHSNDITIKFDASKNIDDDIKEKTKSFQETIITEEQNNRHQQYIGENEHSTKTLCNDNDNQNENLTSITTQQQQKQIQNVSEENKNDQKSNNEKTLSSKQQKQPLSLPMTAAEMRAKLLAKKKYDPKNDSVDLRKKFEIIQKL